VNPDSFIEFLLIAGRLKSIPRTGWLDSGVENPESVADHSYRTALAAMILSDNMGLDTCKVIRIALLHDLAEAEIGDITPQRKKPDHRELENTTMKRILKAFSRDQREKYWETWHEYQNGSSPEACLVHEVDKIEMLLQAYEYQSQEEIPELDRFFDTIVSDVYKEIVNSIKRKRESP
jgi:putative hydrolases of HD superfamily